jgi:hypothetical protein
VTAQLPLIERKERLRSLFSREIRGLCFADHMLGDGPRFREHACKRGVEGIVSKRRRTGWSWAASSWLFLRWQKYLAEVHEEDEQRNCGIQNKEDPVCHRRVLCNFLSSTSQESLDGVNSLLRLGHCRLKVPISVIGARCGGKMRFLLWTERLCQMFQPLLVVDGLETSDLGLRIWATAIIALKRALFD